MNKSNTITHVRLYITFEKAIYSKEKRKLKDFIPLLSCDNMRR